MNNLEMKIRREKKKQSTNNELEQTMKESNRDENHIKFNFPTENTEKLCDKNHNVMKIDLNGG